LGEHHSGYTGFEYDITDYLNYGGTNVVAVRVDATMEEGWFYEGAGIYRDVWLNKTSPVHVASNGTFVTSEVKGGSATVTARATVRNDGKKDASISLGQTVVDAKGEMVAGGRFEKQVLGQGKEKEFTCAMGVPSPYPWSPENPYLYKLITKVFSGDSVVDQYETRFGIRAIIFDPNKGFFLNGKHVLLKGTNNHQDFAGVGTAVPDPLQAFRVKRLKDMGSNAIRCSHNPQSPAFLDACDSLGVLVIDENRLMGSSPEELDELESMIMRDRNHPSVFVWSLGNEEWVIEGNAKGVRIVSTMQDFAKGLDPSRHTTAAVSGGWGQGTSTVIDVMGFNYIANGDIDKQHADFPNQPGMGTEETTGGGTRGLYVEDRSNAHLVAMDRKDSSVGIEHSLKFYSERPFLSGLFFWTGFDYRGEPNPIGWPQVTSQYGIMDLCGFPKDMFYYLQSCWTNSPVLHLFPHWNWKEGQDVDVWAYSNCDEVELFLNTKSLGKKPVSKYSHASWDVKYEPGALAAVGYDAGRAVATDTVWTAADPVAIQLMPDRTALNADGEDVSVITVRVVDSVGRVVPTADNEIVFGLQGPGRIIGVGNGNPSSHAPERYVETVKAIKIEKLKMHALDNSEDLDRVVSAGYDDSEWMQAFEEKDRENRVPHESSKMVVIRGTFDLPEITDSVRVTLLTKSICQAQSVYVNGHLIATKVERDAPGQQYPLDHADLHAGKNVYAVVGPLLIKRSKWEILNTDPGQVQVIVPSSAWKRDAFNGLAQVIVQSEKTGGPITITASSKGLLSGTLLLDSK
jgi:beta-galactosidase